MATVTAVASGLWSATTTWDTGTVPADGDTVVIPSGYTVTFDVDQSAFATGIAGITVDGELNFVTNANSYMKLAGNVSGSGAFYVGKETDPIQVGVTAEIEMVGDYYVQTATCEFWSADLRECIDELAQDALATSTTIVLANGMDLRGGDEIGIGRPAAGSNAEIYTVQNYDPATKTVTLTAGLNYDREAGDLVILLTRNIRVVGNGAKKFLYYGNPGVAKGVYFEGFSTAACYAAHDWSIEYCAKKGGYGFVFEGHDCNFLKCVGWYGYAGIAGGNAMSYGHVAKECATLNATYGSLFENSRGCVAVNCKTQNGLKGVGVSDNKYYNGPNIYIDCSSRYNSSSGFNYTGGGDILIRCSAKGTTYYGFGYDSIFLTLIDCEETASGSGGIWTYPGTVLKNCKFNSSTEVVLVATKCLPVGQVESFNHNQVKGNYQAWMKGGVIITDTSKLYSGHWTYNLICQNADAHVYYQVEITCPADEEITLTVPMQKDFTGNDVKLQVVHPYADPMIGEISGDTYTPIAEATMPDVANQWFNVRVNFKLDDTENVIIRVLVDKRSSGNVWIDPTEILELAKRTLTSRRPGRLPLYRAKN